MRQFLLADTAAARDSNPRSKSDPTILSMFMNSANTLVSPLFSPFMIQLTSVPPGTGVNVKVVGFRALKGLVNWRRILIRLEGSDSNNLHGAAAGFPVAAPFVARSNTRLAPKVAAVHARIHGLLGRPFVPLMEAVDKGKDGLGGGWNN